MEAGSSKLCSVCPPFIFYDSNRWSEERTVSSINDSDRRTPSGRYLYLQCFFAQRGGILLRKGFYQWRVCSVSVLADLLLSDLCERNAWGILEMGGTDTCLCSDLYHTDINRTEPQKDLEEIHITRRELLVVIIIAASVFAMSNLSYLDQDGLFSGSFVTDIFIIRTLVDLSGIAVLYAYHIQVKEIQIRFEKDTLRNIMEMQYKNYQLSKENIDMVNQKYHDLKHQINLLKTQSYASAGKSTSYLEKMEREIRVYETQNKTGNPILDAVLTNKALLCQNKEIELKFIVDGGALSFMEDMDVSALFGNMLDNAIESAQKQQEKQKRLIWLYVTREKQFVRIRTENYCDEKIQFKNGMPVTTKKDRRLHGYGMKSIKSTVEKYNGSVVAAQENNWFELKILLPAAM